MSIPGIAVPGTVVPSGSLTSPGGAQGIQGLQGIQGPISNGFISKTAAYTLTTADSGKYIICSGGSWTLTLPAPVLGLAYQVRNDMGITGTTGMITLQPNGGTIDGQTSLPLLAGQDLAIITDGTNWRTFGRQRTVVVGTQDNPSFPAVFLLPPGYRYYEFVFDAVFAGQASDNLYMQVSFDGGTTWQAANYRRGQIYPSSTTAVAYANATDAVAYLGSISSGALGSTQVRFSPGDATNVARWSVVAAGYDNANTQPYAAVFAGSFNGAGIVNAIRWSGNGAVLSKGLLTVKGTV